MSGVAPRAMVLAAGRGTRLGSASDTRPKPLTMVGGKPVIARVLDSLAAAGVRECVVNTHHLGQMIEDEIGPSHGPLSVAYSRESELLDVAGGIANALPLLGDEPFVLANSDVCSDLDLTLAVEAASGLGDDLACLFLGENPDFRPKGDFSLERGRVRPLAGEGLTYMGCAAFAPSMFSALRRGVAAPLPPLLNEAIADDRVAGVRHEGWWIDAGTPARVEEARVKLGGWEA